jgi:hypothetical protein
MRPKRHRLKIVKRRPKNRPRSDVLLERPSEITVVHEELENNAAQEHVVVQEEHIQSGSKGEDT